MTTPDLIDAARSSAQQMVDDGQAPPAGEAEQRSVAWALKDLSLAAWTSDPPRAVRAAEALARLADAARNAGAAQHVIGEIAALAQWADGIAQLTRARMADALACFDAAAGALHALDLPGPATQTQVAKIIALTMLGRHQDATATAAAAQRDFIAQGDVLSASKVSLNLGSLHLRLDAYADAARHYREAAVLFSRAGQPEHSVMADIGLAGALASTGDMDEADRMLRRARMRAGAHGLPPLEALADESQALLDLARGRYGAALASFEHARRGYERLDMPQHLAIAEKQLADAYLELRLLPEALALYEQALAKFGKLDMPDDTAWTLTQRGRTEALLNRPDDAAASFEQAATLFDAQGSGAGKASVTLARAELVCHTLPVTGADQVAKAAGAAAVLASEAADGFAAAGSAPMRVHAQATEAGARYLAGQLDAAQTLYQQALKDAQTLQLLDVEQRCLTGLGLIALRGGIEPTAQAHFETAIALFEDQRRALPGDELRSAFLSNHLRPYAELLRLALQRHAALEAGAANADGLAAAATDALAMHERFRARVTGERLAQAGRETEHDAPELQALRARHHWLHRREQSQLEEGTPSAALTDELRATERELLERTRRARLAEVPADGSAVHDDGFSIEALRSVLSDGDALVEYAIDCDALHAWVIRRDGVQLVQHLSHWPDVQDALRSARFQIEALSHGSDLGQRHLAGLTARTQVRMARLHALLWAPLAGQLHDAARVLIVAPGALGALPFGALYDGQAVLAQRHQLAYASSARIAWLRIAVTPPAPHRALVMADTRALRHAGQEAARVAQLFDHVETCLGEQAQVGMLTARAPHADVVHLACHARFRSDNPAFSALHLADGAFTAELAERLHLPPGIVVLSACETALASGADGDERVGLVRAFLLAGAARVVASLWSVDDAVTALFMAHFYGALAQRRSAADALAAAQTAVMRQHPHPYYWAAFGLHGGW